MIEIFLGPSVRRGTWGGYDDSDEGDEDCGWISRVLSPDASGGGAAVSFAPSDEGRSRTASSSATPYVPARL